MSERGASKSFKSYCMNFPTALASLPFSLCNCTILYAWNLYSSNTSSWYFLSNAGRVASIFSSFVVHNGLYSRLTGKWQSLPKGSGQREVPIDRSLKGCLKGPKSLDQDLLSNHSETDRSFSQDSAWSHASSFCPNRLDMGGMWWSIDKLSKIVGKLVWRHS